MVVFCQTYLLFSQISFKLDTGRKALKPRLRVAMTAGSRLPPCDDSPSVRMTHLGSAISRTARVTGLWLDYSADSKFDYNPFSSLEVHRNTKYIKIEILVHWWPDALSSVLCCDMFCRLMIPFNRLALYLSTPGILEF